MESILKAVGLKKYYGSGETRVRALDGVCLLYTSDAADDRRIV